MPPINLAEFKSSKAGKIIAQLLSAPEEIARMETLSQAGRPAVLALDAALPADMHLGNTEKQHAGRMIRERMREGGWRVGPRRQIRHGRIFSSGAVYERSRQPPAEAAIAHAPAADDFETRMRWAQEVVERESSNAYGVDDFIRDRRAEAAREGRH